MRSRPLSHGDVIEVRSPQEILATLDQEGALDALPFMPEMIQCCGRRFVVDQRADKICDNIKQSGSRRLGDTVLLADLRCDGSGHDGCEADCRIFWKSAWLRRVDPAAPPPAQQPDDAGRAALQALLERSLRQRRDIDTWPAGSWRCQATEMHRASTPLATKDPRPYLRELASGNVALGRFLRVFPRAVYDEVRHKLKLLPEASGRPELPRGAVAAAAPPPEEEKLDLQPGEWVRVRPLEEIVATLSPKGKNKGLWFDREMIPHAGRTYRVRRRVNRFIDEANGRMVVLKSGCVTLEGAACSGDLSLGRWFCPRGIYPFWREVWLRRAEPPQRSP